MSSIHKITFAKYEKLHDNVSFSDVVKELTHTGQLVEWSASDFLHLMKNGGARIAKGSLSFGADDAGITAKQPTKELESMNIGTVFEARNTLDLLKNDPPSRHFNSGTY
jgi:hypothetical protein